MRRREMSSTRFSPKSRFRRNRATAARETLAWQMRQKSGRGRRRPGAWSAATASPATDRPRRPRRPFRQALWCVHPIRCVDPAICGLSLAVQTDARREMDRGRVVRFGHRCRRPATRDLSSLLCTGGACGRGMDLRTPHSSQTGRGGTFSRKTGRRRTSQSGSFGRQSRST